MNSGKHWAAIGFGAAMIGAAIILAAGSTNQDQSARPEVARAIETEFHTTPSSTPLPTATPVPTPTPRRITDHSPSVQEILDALFQYPYQNAFIIPSPEDVKIAKLGADEYPDLVITGDRATGTDGVRAFPAAFGAVLAWDAGEYVIKFRHVEFGQADERASVSITPGGRVTWLFRDVVNRASEPVAEFQQTIVLYPCDIQLNETVQRILEHSRLGSSQFGCY